VLWFLNVDALKDEVHFRMFREFGSSGYHHFPREAANAKRDDRSKGPGSVGWIFSHFMRAKRTVSMKEGREKRIWEEHGRHDLWDCTAYCLGGAFVTLADILDEAQASHEAPARETADRPRLGQGSIRTSY
jgi:phage terminase large subunit GpA-like protein